MGWKWELVMRDVIGKSYGNQCLHILPKKKIINTYLNTRRKKGNSLNTRLYL